MKLIFALLSVLFSLQLFGYKVVHVPAGEEPPKPQRSVQSGPFAPPSSPNAPELVDFKVSKVGNNKSQLLEVFGIIQQNESDQPKGTTFQIMQRIDQNNFLVYKFVTKTNVVSSSMASIAGGGNVRSNSYLSLERTKVSYLKYNRGLDAVDGEKVKDLSVVLTKEIETYATAVGSMKSVRVYKEALNERNIFSREEFVEKLRAGETWVIRSYLAEECFPCKGTGRLNQFNGGGRCDKCKGKGDLTKDLLVKW